MSIRLRCFALTLMLCLGLSGCSPTPETQLDEQKNPHYLAGMEKLGALDYKGAVESFERAVEDNPRSAFAHFRLGVIFEQHENDYASALYHYNRAIKLRPDGFPAENIRQRIPGCKQELVKTDSLTVINPTVLRETEKLREENAALRKHIELLQGQLAGRPAVSGSAIPAAGTGMGRGVASPSLSTNQPVRSVGSPGGAGIVSQDGTRLAAARVRTHSVKAGETPTSIARQYSIRVGSLLSANPGLDAKRMRVGQVLNIPSS